MMTISKPRFSRFARMIFRSSTLLVPALVFVMLPFTGAEAAKVSKEAKKLAAELPIADLHMHPRTSISPAKARDWMDKNGVRWAGLGGGAREAYARELGDRFIAFAGQTELIGLLVKRKGGELIRIEGGIEAIEDANNPVIQDLLRQSEEDLKAGRIKGIGELFPNNSHSSKYPAFRNKFRADAPSMRALYQLVAKYGGFLTFHMEAERDSIAQLERLLASDRRGRVLWNHCGVDARAKEVRPVLARNSNLFCELAVRYPPVLREQVIANRPTRLIFGRGKPNRAWLELIEEFPDRFMIGTDAHDRSKYDGSIKIVRTRLLPYLRPSTARKVAHENAQRLFGLK